MANAATRPTVAVIAPGNMGAAVGARLTQNGARVFTLLEGRSSATVKRAADAGMKDASEAEIAGADFLLSIVPPGEALGLAKALKPALRAANRKPVYVECNAVSPQTVSEIGAVIAEADCPFVDGGIIGPPPRVDSSKTRLYVSGPDAARVGALNQYGLVIRVMDDTVGHASALKMSYGALNKGVIALGATMALAAGRAGVGDAFRAELAESQSDLLGKLARAVPDMLPKAYRWVAEFEEVARFTGTGSEAEIFNSIAKLYDRIAKDFEGPKAETSALARFYEKAAERAK
jgi:3-hydroxyisobutyrate dehydrogenase-like beta-hydroxyacid dehydrogenase